MSATRCTCIGEMWCGLWLVVLPDPECKATHRVSVEQ